MDEAEVLAASVAARRDTATAWAVVLSALLASVSGPGAPPSPPAQEGHLVAADGVKLFYRRVGTGRDAVVYLHGGPGSNFRGQGDYVERLATRQRTVVLYDQRGSGLSELVTDPKLLMADHHVRDLEALRQHFGFERMSLVGMSWGSGLAVQYAAAHPDRVERLLLLSPMPPTARFFAERLAKLTSLGGPATDARRKEILDHLPRAGDQEAVALCRELSDATFRLYVVDPTPAKLRHAALRCEIPPAAIRNRYVVQAATMASLGQWDFRPLLAGIRVPSLVVEGERTNVPLEATRQWAATLPNARLLLIPGAGHEAFLDRPEVFVKASDEFLNGRIPSGAVAGSGQPAR